MLTLKEQKYYENLNFTVDKAFEMIKESLKGFDSEYEFQNSNPDDWDLSNAQNYRRALRSDDYTIMKSGVFHSGWRVVTALNGLQSWQNKKGELHPVHSKIGWFDRCYDFDDAGAPTMFRKKNIGSATGSKDNVSYNVYADGTYEYDNSGNVERHTDVNGNTTEKYRYGNTLNHDHTYTTAYVNSNPDGKFDPGRMLRYSVDSSKKEFFRNFVTIWTRYWENNKYDYQKETGLSYNEKGIVGFDEGTSRYIFDISNQSGIYSLVQKLDIGLTNGTVKITNIDRGHWFSKYDKTENNLYEDSQGGYSYDEYDSYDDDNNESNKIPGGTGYIEFGNNIEFIEQEEPSVEKTGPSVITVRFTDSHGQETSEWAVNPSTNQWINQPTNTQIGTVTIENDQQNRQTKFILKNQQENTFTFTIDETQLQMSNDSKRTAQDIPIYFMTGNGSSSIQVGTVSIEYTVGNY